MCVGRDSQQFLQIKNWYFEFIIEVYWYKKLRKETLLTNIQKTGR